MYSLECYFGVCCSTREINTKKPSREQINSSPIEYIHYCAYKTTVSYHHQLCPVTCICSHSLIGWRSYGTPLDIHYNDVTMDSIASQITSITIVYSAVCSGADQRKHQSSASLAFVRGIHRGPVDSPHKWPVTRKMFPFDDVIWKWLSSVPHWNHWLQLTVAQSNKTTCILLHSTTPSDNNSTPQQYVTYPMSVVPYSRTL